MKVLVPAFWMSPWMLLVARERASTVPAVCAPGVALWIMSWKLVCEQHKPRNLAHYGGTAGRLCNATGNSSLSSWSEFFGYFSQFAAFFEMRGRSAASQGEGKLKKGRRFKLP